MSAEVAASAEMKAYFKQLNDDAEICYQLADKARREGKDPQLTTEIPRAEDLASRVEKLLSDYHVEGVADDIRRLTAQYGNREIVALKVAQEFAHRPAESKEKTLDRAVRVGLAVLTEGILVAPLEGIAGTYIKTNPDGSTYTDLVFAGPIRAAGGTGQAMSVLIADVVRQELGVGKYVATEGEVERFDEEIPLYKQCQHLQFTPTPQEIHTIVKDCPVMVDGEGTERVEISGFRDLPRIATNRVRGGACLVIAEGMCLKASKIKKHVDKLGIKGWDFIQNYLDLHKAVDTDTKSNKKVVEPATKYLRDMVAGRPIFGHPCAVGGFRLRYGRARTSGLAALAYNPASMYAMDEFMAIGTQLKIERPGKACVVTPVDSIEGPIVLLKNGDLVYCGTVAEYQKIRDQVAEVVDNGEILVPFGEFCENNHVLVPCGYPIEWHREELKAAVGEGQPLPDDWKDPTYARAKEMCARYKVALHPKYNLFWSDVKVERLNQLRDAFIQRGSFSKGYLYLPKEPVTKRILEDLGALHKGSGAVVVIDKQYGEPMIDCLGLQTGPDGKLTARTGPLAGPETDVTEAERSLAAVSTAAGYRVMARAMTRIGTRMGRPEKAKERAGAPMVHALFPLSEEKLAVRDTASAIKALHDESNPLDNTQRKTLNVEMGARRCPKCGDVTYRCWCRKCGCHTDSFDKPKTEDGKPPTVPVDIETEYNDALAALKEPAGKETLKCMDKLTSKHKTPETLEKGILRRKHDISIFRDGTIRYDMTDIPITHFKPREIGLSIEKAHELGYTHDWNGDPLTDPEQIVELKCQDIIPARECGDYMVRVAQFIDDELDLIYHLPRFYNAQNRSDLIGRIVFGLAPHTSGCILCRIIGYSNVLGCYGHPFYHAAKRRNCDGDEDCIILALDALLNFSRSFLPDRRGGLMDCPLVLTTRLDPNEIDKEAHNVDCRRFYPREFYYAAMDMQDPKTIDKQMDLIGGRIGTPQQYEGLGFTHDTHDISEGPKKSAYTTLGSMTDKMTAQLSLGIKCRAVDARDVAMKVINKHFMPDMIGNLRSFATQTVRCTKCGTKYRRVPLSGVCNNCGHSLNLTVHEASVRKYLQVSKEVCEKYDLDDYTKERIAIIEMSMNSLFNNDKIKKCKLSDFY
ncbi:MAG: DNA polymerase II large subunit [Candidatus Methanomethylophilus sp.]|nr:DNA polymerase II large subunit [Methanomethylophilus sp.]MDD4221645.1 DNA polymerase II large subunit [Methanomethylophilus sp.]MDD4668286.1 DNA polymerase II large subunit [Methanomethylophilus sp.]